MACLFATIFCIVIARRQFALNNESIPGASFPALPGFFPALFRFFPGVLPATFYRLPVFSRFSSMFFGVFLKSELCSIRILLSSSPLHNFHDSLACSLDNYITLR